MKNILFSALISVGSIGSIVATTPTAAYSQDSTPKTASERRFYCGQAQDPTSKKMLPATLMENQGESESKVVVIWKSDIFNKFTPQKRCDIVSPKFQAAYAEGRGYLTSGFDGRSRQGIVCLVANENDECNISSMLFTLKSFQDANKVIENLALYASGLSGIPETQTLGRRTVKISNLRRK
jgi:hypothetical protein